MCTIVRTRLDQLTCHYPCPRKKHRDGKSHVPKVESDSTDKGKWDDQKPTVLPRKTHTHQSTI